MTESRQGIMRHIQDMGNYQIGCMQSRKNSKEELKCIKCFLIPKIISVIFFRLCLRYYFSNEEFKVEKLYVY